MSNLVDVSNNRIHVIIVRDKDRQHKDIYTNAKGILHVTVPNDSTNNTMHEIGKIIDHELSKNDGIIPFIITPESIKIDYIKLE